MFIKIRIYITLLIILLFSVAIEAKDALIPGNIDGNNNKTLYNYDLINHSKFKLTIADLQEQEPKFKEIYDFHYDKKNYHILKYVVGLDDSFLNLSLKDIVFTPDKEYFIMRINPIFKPIIKQKKPLEFYNIASLNLQSELQCPVTPTVKQIDINKPRDFNITNNLRRKIKTTFVASGDIIYIKGHVQDVNCVPIENAMINIWQADGYGKLSTDTGHDMYFLGNGTAISDNMGNFSFITILPNRQAKLADIAPHINISVKHRNFDNIDTKMYFAKNIFNDKDKTLKELDEFTRELIIAELIPVEFSELQEGYFMLFDITLNGVSAYRNL